MAKRAPRNETAANVGYEAELWRMADALRGSMDAAEYKHVVLGLIFLKYISDAFEEQHAHLLAEQAQGADPEDPDEYRLDRKYLYAFLRSPGFRAQLASRAGETDMAPYVSLTSQRGLSVVLPPIDEQRGIAHVLGTLDDKIELNRRMNETLEAAARALFQSWFVDFDPVRAKAAGRDPGLPEEIAELFPDRFEESELGEIPAGWRVGRLSDLCSTQYGYTASGVNKPVGPKLLRVTDINKQDWIDWGDVPHCTIDPGVRASYALQLGDVVVARMADPGKSAIIEDDIDAVFASYLVRLKMTSLAYSYYVYGFLKSELYAEYSGGAKSGSVQASMNAKFIVAASLIVPPKAIIERFFQSVFPLRQRLAANVRQSCTLAALRDTLLPKLISGELRVRDAAGLVDPVDTVDEVDCGGA